jgi:undecaprenyl-diphosphatase
MRLTRDEAARLSFLLLIPIVFGASLLKGVKDVAFGGLPPGSAGPFVVGMIAAAVVGLVAIWVLLGYVRRHTYSVFVIYRLALAATILIVIAAGWRDKNF